MQKYKARFLKVMGLSVLLLGLTFYSSGQALAASNPVDISISPDSLLFDITNMKPGDWAERTLTIQNRGETHFNYNTKAEFKGGSEKLYNEFLLEVMDSSGPLFEGKLSNFTQLEPRYLKSFHEEDLKFTIRFPYELGNEFQGLQFEVVFKFITEGKPPNTPDPPKDPEPPKQPDPPKEPEPPKQPDPPEQPEEPKEPEQPDPPVDKDPDDPEQPGGQDEDENDKEQPQKPVEEEEDEAVLLPQRPIDGKDLVEKVKEGQILPSTATNTYNYLIFGLLMIMVGFALYIYSNRRTLQY